MRLSRLWLRSVPGQLTLFAVVFVGALVVSFIPWLLRDRVFEYYSRELDMTIGPPNLEAAKVLGDPRTADTKVETVFEEITARDRKERDTNKRGQSLEQLYAAWMQGEDIGEGEVLARRLVEHKPTWTLERVRRTLVAGNVEQRKKAVEFLSWILKEQNVSDRVKELLRFARLRAKRRGEQGLVDQVDEVLR